MRMLRSPLTVVLAVAVGTFLLIAGAPLIGRLVGPRTAGGAIRIIMSSDDPCVIGEGIGVLVELSRNDTTVVDAIVEAIDRAPSGRKWGLVYALTQIWEVHNDDRAHAALVGCLDDPDVALEVAFALARNGDAAGADVLRVAAAQNAGTDEDAQYERDDARSCLESLGLDWTDAGPAWTWTSEVALGPGGVGVFEGEVTLAQVEDWDRELPKLTVAAPGLSRDLVVTVPMTAEVFSAAGTPLSYSDFIDSLSEGDLPRARFAAEDVAGWPWARRIDLLDR